MEHPERMTHVSIKDLLIAVLLFALGLGWLRISAALFVAAWNVVWQDNTYRLGDPYSVGSVVMFGGYSLAIWAVVTGFGNARSDDTGSYTLFVIVTVACGVHIAADATSKILGIVTTRYDPLSVHILDFTHCYGNLVGAMILTSCALCFRRFPRHWRIVASVVGAACFLSFVVGFINTASCLNSYQPAQSIRRLVWDYRFKGFLFEGLAVLTAMPVIVALAMDWNSDRRFRASRLLAVVIVVMLFVSGLLLCRDDRQPYGFPRVLSTKPNSRAVLISIPHQNADPFVAENSHADPFTRVDVEDR